MLATLIACEESVSDAPGEDRLGDSYVSGDSDTGTDTGTDTVTSAVVSPG